MKYTGKWLKVKVEKNFSLGYHGNQNLFFISDWINRCARNWLAQTVQTYHSRTILYLIIFCLSNFSEFFRGLLKIIVNFG